MAIGYNQVRHRNSRCHREYAVPEATHNDRLRRQGVNRAERVGQRDSISIVVCSVPNTEKRASGERGTREGTQGDSKTDLVEKAAGRYKRPTVAHFRADD